MGESLGGGVMVDLAAKDGARALVLENTFTSLPDVAAFHYPWLPVQLLMRTRLDSAAKIGDYHGPLLQIHGDADTIIPFEPWPAAVRRGQRAEAVGRHPRRRPQRPAVHRASPGARSIPCRTSHAGRPCGNVRSLYRTSAASVTTTMIEQTINLGQRAQQPADESGFADLQARVEVASFPALADHRAGQRPQSAKHHGGDERTDDRNRQADEHAHEAADDRTNNRQHRPAGCRPPW